MVEGSNPALKDIDFSRLRFPVHTVPHGTDLVHKFPELQLYKEFHQYPHSDRNYVIRYVIYMYDMNSGLIKKFPNLKQRKEAALDLAGFERTKGTGKFKKEIVDMVNLEKVTTKIPGEEGEDDKTVVESNKIFDMVMRYIVIQKSRLWSMIVTNEAAFEEYQRLIMEAVSDKKDKELLAAAQMKDELMECSDKISKRIDAYYKDFFGDNEELKEEIKKKPVRPELY
jgi:hypothetical protein